MRSSPRAILARGRISRRTVRVVSLLTALFGCLLVAVGAVGLPLAPKDSGRGVLGNAAEERVRASGAATVYADQGGRRDPGAADEPPATLRAGDVDGGAVTYLTFRVPARRQPLDRAVVRLTSPQERLPGLVELIAVPDTGWQPERLTWADAPLPGREVRSVRPEPRQQQAAFDVTDLVAEPGVLGFAVTVPPDLPHAEFAGPGEDGEPILHLSWARPAPVRGPVAPTRSAPPTPLAPPSPYAPARAPASAVPQPQADPPECVLGDRLVPTCGVLWGVAPDAHTGSARSEALARFERETGRRQHIYHAYHRGQDLFPTAEEVTVAAGGRLLFLNWKPHGWTWAQIAAGDPAVDSYLDQLARHIRTTFTDPFFFTIHHEPENDVRPRRGSGWEAADYAAMFRHVVQRLRGAGVENLVTVVNYMAYVPWNAQPWFPDLYPGDDVVDWVAWNAYAYSDPGYGHGDFGELVNRRAGGYRSWPGFYTWAATQFPDKPFMLGEWGVWHSARNPGHMADFYDSAARQIPLLPRLNAIVYFDTPGDQRSRDSRPTTTEAGLAAYRRLGAQRHFQVELAPAGPGYRAGDGS